MQVITTNFMKADSQVEDGDLVYLVKGTLCFRGEKGGFSSMQWKNNQSHCHLHPTQITGLGKFFEFTSHAVLPKLQLLLAEIHWKVTNIFFNMCNSAYQIVNQKWMSQ